MKKKFSMVPLTKKMVPVLLSAVFLLPLAAHSEIKAGSVELSPFAGYNFFDNQHNIKDRPVFGGRIGYNFTNHFGIEGTGEFSKTRVDDRSATATEQGQFTSPIDDVKITSYHLDLVYHFLPEKRFNPFIAAGYGAAHFNPEINSKNMRLMDFGVGAKYWLAEHVALRVDLRDNMIFDENLHNLAATAGVVFAFGGEKKATAVAEEKKPVVIAEEKKPVVVAAKAAPADTTAPTVMFTSPVKGATAAPVDQKVNVAFSEPVDPATITASTFTVKQGATTVPGKVTSSAAVATFAPAGDFEKGKVYTGTVTRGAKDLAGNPLANNYVWDFTAHSDPVLVPCVLTTIEDSHFAYNSAEINENGKTILDLNIRALKDNPKTKVRIAGYASASGTEEYNQQLSEKRASAVKDYLVKGGIRSDRLSTIGYGETSPLEYEAVPSDIYSDAAKANMKVLFEVIVK